MTMGKQPANAWAVPAAIIAITMLGLPGDLTAQDARQVQNVKDFVTTQSWVDRSLSDAVQAVRLSAAVLPRNILRFSCISHSAVLTFSA